MKMEKLTTYAPLAARVLLGGFFLLSGLSKLGDVAGFTAFMQMGGLPAFLAWPAILFEIAVGAAVIIGFQARFAALAGAAFCIVAAVLYHGNWSDPADVYGIQKLMFMKNFAIAGGFLMIFGKGAGALAVDKA